MRTRGCCIAGVAIGMFFIVLMATLASAFDCGGKIISKGDSIDLVIARCGEPNGGRVIRKEFSGGSTGTSTYLGRGRFSTESTFDGTSETLDTITYNCGEGRLIHALGFKGGGLENIETAGHGKGPRRCE